MREPWLTQREIAKELRISIRTLRKLDPPCLPVGGQKRYHLSEVEAYLRNGAPLPPEPIGAAK